MKDGDCDKTEWTFPMCPQEQSSVPKSGEWGAQWIWLGNTTFPDRQKCRSTTFCKNEFPHTVALFRKTFTIPFAPRKATMWVSGDTKYRCRVNGDHVVSGPAEVGGDFGNRESPDWWFYEGVELSDLLRKGHNVIAADVLLGPQVQADYSMGRGGFLLEMLIEGENGEELVVGTDDSWRATASESESQAAVYDARKEILGWTGLECDDANWPAVDIIGPAVTSGWNLLPREIPMLAQTRVPPTALLLPSEERQVRIDPAPSLNDLFPVTVKPGIPLTFRLQFPRELAGQIFLHVDGAEGTRLDVEFRELREGPGTREMYILPGREWSYQSRRLQGFEYVQMTVTFPDGVPCKTPLTIHALDAVFTSFPVSYRGEFDCSDPFLNQLWDVGRWTTQLCMQSYHLDSPIHQEGLGCTGDYMIEALISYCCFGESRLARKDILRTAYLLKQKQGKMFHTSYSLLWVWMVRDYWMYSGDEEVVGEVMEVLHNLLDLFDSYVGESGLITEAPNYMFMDWVDVGDYSLHHPPASMGQGYMSAFYFRALQYGAEWSRLRGDAHRAELYERRAAALKAAFNDYLWSPARGLYRDGIPGATKITPSRWMPADPDEDSFTIHTNALAVAVGIAPLGQGQAIMHKALSDDSLPVVQPYFMHFVFEALARAERFEKHAFGLMDRWRPVLEEHPSSLKETWDGGDYSHAWSGTSTYQLSTRVLGVSVREPAFRSFSLHPRLGPLQSARGTVPTPRGPIEISWQREGASLKGVLRGTAGCDVYVDTGSEDCRGIKLLKEGHPIDELTTTPDGVCWTLTGGEYSIEFYASG